MKVISLIVLCAGMGVAGYFLYDGIIPVLLNASTQSTSDPMIRSVTFEDDNGSPKEVTLDLHKILPTQYPDKVTLNSDADVKSEDGSLSETLVAGTVVSPRNVRDGKLVIKQENSTLSGLIDFKASDFESKLALKMFAAATPPPTENMEATQPAMPAEPIAPPTPTQAPQPETQPTATPTPAPKPETQPQPELAPAPPAETKANIDAKEGSLNEAQVITLMKESLKAGQVTEFKIEQVKSWKKEADETIDKQSYQVGLAAFEANTIFGTEILKAKALIKNGKVVRWVWPRSGMNIR